MPADDDDADSGTQRTAVFWIVGVPLRFTSNEHGRAGFNSNIFSSEYRRKTPA